MIYTVTLNPSIDYVVTLDHLSEGRVNRVNSEHFYPGGKGINVSQVLTQLGYENTALGYISGFSGTFIEQELNQKGIHADFIKLTTGNSRINMKIKAVEETEINGQGPEIQSDDIAALYKKLDHLSDDDLLVLAGSIPGSLPEDFYEQIMKHLEDKNISIVVDATKNLLLNVLKYRPFLIKPNHHEIAEMFNVEIKNTDDLIEYGNKLKEMGARNVLISRGGEGALLLTEDNQIFESNVPKGVVKNSVGAGDSMVAGFIAGYLKNKDFKEALKLGAASGSATAFSSDVATSDYIHELINQIEVNKL
ncbi:MAG: 1-phosphofructokinase [Turicibacter sp.]